MQGILKIEKKKMGGERVRIIPSNIAKEGGWGYYFVLNVKISGAIAKKRNSLQTRLAAGERRRKSSDFDPTASQTPWQRPAIWGQSKTWVTGVTKKCRRRGSTREKKSAADIIRMGEEPHVIEKNSPCSDKKQRENAD